ncbi:hypothetical protein A0H81_13601 [Grifola frondosa]|uniref:Uncharacterized protein n=1 Tax=Grifola frondosa TaxID=5627 RepID=A0A1C7LQG9_GRIFR|nr:hypothetical protein A0H81_13601 [Grifola frondosa]
MVFVGDKKYACETSRLTFKAIRHWVTQVVEMSLRPPRFPADYQKSWKRRSLCKHSRTLQILTTVDVHARIADHATAFTLEQAPNAKARLVNVAEVKLVFSRRSGGRNHPTRRPCRPRKTQG